MLVSRTLPMSGATGELQAEVIHEVLEEYHSKDTLKAVLVDNTAVNTGHTGRHFFLSNIHLY